MTLRAPGAEAGLAEFARRMPKVELHVHLEGSMRPETLLALAAEHGVALPADDVAGIRRWFRFRDFAHFVQIYLTCSACLREPEDFYRLAIDFLAGQAEENAVWSEVHFTVSTHVANGVDGSAVMQALVAASDEGRRRFGVELRLIPDVVRNMPTERADLTLEWGLEGARRGLVVALGLSGFEASHPNEPFRDHFARAATAGLHRVAHAGEHAGPASIRSALEVVGAERIGHGVRAVEDPALVAELAARRIPLEVCPSSNVCLGVFPDLAHHTFDRLWRAGVEVSVGSDDPPFFDTTLSGEYLRLAATFGYTAADLAALSLAGLRHSFLPPAEKEVRRAEFCRRFAELGEEIWGRPVVVAGEDAAGADARRRGETAR